MEVSRNPHLSTTSDIPIVVIAVVVVLIVIVRLVTMKVVMSTPTWIHLSRRCGADGSCLDRRLLAPYSAQETAIRTLSSSLQTLQSLIIWLRRHLGRIEISHGFKVTARTGPPLRVDLHQRPRAWCGKGSKLGSESCLRANPLSTAYCSARAHRSSTKRARLCSESDTPPTRTNGVSLQAPYPPPRNA